MTDTILLPCPFCGTEPEFPNVDEVYGTCYDAGCNDCWVATISIQIIDCFDYGESPNRDDAHDSWDKEASKYGDEFIEVARTEAAKRWNTRQAAPPSTAQEDSSSYIEDHAKHLLKVSEKMAKTLNEGGRMDLPKHWQKVPFRIEKLSEALSKLSDEQKHEAINDLCSQLGIDRSPSYADFNRWIKLHLKSPDNCGHYMIDAEELRQFITTGVVDK